MKPMALYCRQSRGRGKAVDPSGSAAALICAGLVAMMAARAVAGEAMSMSQPATSAAVDTEGTLIWRRSECDGLNCLYVLLRVHGYRESYAAYRRLAGDAQQYRTLQSLEKLARRSGYEFACVSMTAKQLRSARRPVLVHEEHQGVTSGDFCLYLGGSRDSVQLVYGPSMVWVETSRERFERNWTGYALVARPRAAVSDTIRRLVAAFCVAYVGCGFLVRARPRRDRSGEAKQALTTDGV